MLLKFADNLLSKDQMKEVKGGNGGRRCSCDSSITAADPVKCSMRCEFMYGSNCVACYQTI